MKKTILFIVILNILFVISAYHASAADRLMGDVNGDGIVSVSDATDIQRHIAELELIPDEALSFAMVSDDDELSVSDATLVQMYAAEMIEKFPAEMKQDELSMKMTINNIPVDVKWEENDAVKALRDAVKDDPLTIQTSMYGGFEQVGPLGMELPRNDTRITTEPGDVILYSGNQIVVFYGSNTWAYTRLGNISGKTQAELKELLSNGSVTIVISK
jgi:hypothetical protein